MNITVNTDKNITSLTPQLGLRLWNIAVMFAPYDTGNLRRAITMNTNSATRKKIVYNALNAQYLHYLEMGEGSVKKHTGFISQTTVNSFILSIISYFMNGGDDGVIFGKPVVTLRESRNGAMFSEKKILKSLDLGLESLTGDDRRKLSQIRYRGLMDSNLTRSGGQSVKLKRQYKMSQNKKIDMWYMDKEGYETDKFTNKIQF